MLSLKENLKEQLAIDLDTKVLRVIDKLLNYAIGCEAEEISFEPQEDRLTVNFLASGELQQSLALPKKSAEAVIAGLKKIAGLDERSDNILERGKFKKDFLGYKIIFSLSAHPTAAGEKVIVGLKKEKFQLLEPGRLGLMSRALAVVKKNLAKRKGLILVIGDYNSGRTTTLYSFLNFINQPDLNAATVEKDIAYDLPGVNQSRLDSLSGFNSASAVNSLRRQDADVAMIGEINDKETADAAIQMALAGHFVLGGLYSRDLKNSLIFLQDLSVPLPLFTAAVKLTVTGRLADKNCPHCLARQKIGQETWQRIKMKFSWPALLEKMRQEKLISEKITKPEDLVFYKSQGCPRCSGSGISGKIGIFEVLEITPEVKKMIGEGHFSALEGEVKKQGLYSLAEDALIKSLNGSVTIETVLKTTE